MTNWKKYKFSEFVEINPSVKFNGNGFISYVEMKDLNENNKYCYPSDNRVLSSGSRFINGDTLFARITPCLENGKICQVRELKDGIGFGSTEFLVFRGKKGISDNDFIYYLSIWERLKSHAELSMTGTSGRQRVQRKAFDELEILLPPLSEQQAIASILSSLDDKIELNRRQNETLEKIAQAVFKHWFVDFNYPGATGEMTDSELGKIPKGWRVGKLGEIIELVYGKALKEENRITGDYVVVGSNGLVGTHSEYLVEAPGIVIGRKGTIGEVNWIDKHFYPIDTTFYIRDLMRVDGLYFHYFILKAQDFKRINSDSAVPGLNRNEAYKNEIIIPDRNVVVMFNRLVQEFFLKKKVNKEQNEVLSSIRDSLLPKLMSGKVRMKV